MTELCHTGRGLSEEFDEDFQNRLTAYFCRDHEFLTRAGDLVVPSQFANAANAILVNMVSGYYRMYKSAPSSSARLSVRNYSPMLLLRLSASLQKNCLIPRTWLTRYQPSQKV